MQYFESGYNGQAWTQSRSAADFFYFEMSSCFTGLTLLQEWELALSFLRQTPGGFQFIDDNSFLSQVIKPYLRSSEVISCQEFIFDPNLWQKLYDQYKIQYPEDLFFLSLSQNRPGYVLWPQTSGRIFNMNYRKYQRKSLGPAYWTYLEPERFHKVRLAARDMGLKIVPDLTKISCEFMRAFFLHPYHLEFYTEINNQQAHNDLVERKIWQGLQPQVQDLYAKAKFPAVTFEFKAHDEQTATFPLHILLMKYFSFPNNLNQNERVWYGSVD